MSSLHTKYRPSTFAQVVGQDKAIESLGRVVREARAKTFLFTGPAGVGKTTLARILAAEFAGGSATAANIEEVDAATNSGVDAVRALVTRSMFRAVGASSVKAIVVDECHKLSSGAWNALLKPIEEPPKHVYWCFCSTEPGKIPKTIQTRCLRYDLKLVDDDLLYELLLKVAEAEKFDTSEDVLEAIAAGSGGSPRQALVNLEACQYCESPGEARSIMRTGGQTREAVDLARFLTKGRGQTWAEAIKHIKALEGQEAEGIRIALVNYLGAVLMNTKGDEQAAKLLSVLDVFLTPYNQSDRMAPLLKSVGLAMGLDQ